MPTSKTITRKTKQKKRVHNFRLITFVFVQMFLMRFIIDGSTLGILVEIWKIAQNLKNCLQ